VQRPRIAVAIDDEKEHRRGDQLAGSAEFAPCGFACDGEHADGLASVVDLPDIELAGRSDPSRIISSIAAIATSGVS
jgi:hypothetical protein